MKQYIKQYKRLTNQKWSDDIDLTQELGYSHIYKMLHELEDKIENGTLVFLPCKVGDTVYFVNYRFGGKPIEPYIVDRITITLKQVIFDTHQVEPPYNLGLIYSDSWGRNVFFTKEAAEKALEELEK